jgi:predicted transcriptional regulator
LTHLDLAKRLGVTQGRISKIEGRNFEVSEALMKRVNKALRQK